MGRTELLVSVNVSERDSNQIVLQRTQTDSKGNVMLQNYWQEVKQRWTIVCSRIIFSSRVG